jgi:hypothetical protein
MYVFNNILMNKIANPNLVNYSYPLCDEIIQETYNKMQKCNKILQN